MPLWFLIPVVVGFTVFLSGCSKQDGGFTTEDIKDASQGDGSDSLCVEGAKVMCTSCSGDTSNSCMKKTGDASITMQGAPELNNKDIEFEPLFTKCIYSDDEKCKPEIENNEWQDYDEMRKCGDGYALIREQSYMFCKCGFGMLYITEDGQRDLNVEKDLAIQLNSQLAQWLYMIEAPAEEKDEDGNPIIRPQNITDGYITIGAGHIIQTKEDAIKYGFDIEGMRYDGELSDDKIDDLIARQRSNYTTTSANPAILTPDEAKALLAEDMEGARAIANKYAGDTGKSYTSNQMDAITSQVFNGTNINSTNNVTYYFLKQDEQGALNIIQTAMDEGWYGEHEGLFRRRLMEYNIYCNDDYTFYDDHELDTLKAVVGYPGD